MWGRKAAEIRNLQRLVRVRTAERDEARGDHKAAHADIRSLAAQLAEQQQKDAAAAAALAEADIEHPDQLWSLIDWSLWGSGMGDTFREQLADQFIRAITPQQHEQALRLIQAWTDSGRLPLGRERYEEQQGRLHRALRACKRYRRQATVDRTCFNELAARYWDALGYGPDTLAKLDPSYATEAAE